MTANQYRGVLLALWVALLFSLALPTFAGAQTLTLDVNRTTIPGLGTQFLAPAELDGNPATREYYQTDLDPATQQVIYRTVAVRATVTFSPWFNPWNFAHFYPGDVVVFGYITRAGDRDRFIYSGQQGYGEITLPVGGLGQ